MLYVFEAATDGFLKLIRDLGASVDSYRATLFFCENFQPASPFS